jgi:polycomb protein SUZ12
VKKASKKKLGIDDIAAGLIDERLRQSGQAGSIVLPRSLEAALHNNDFSATVEDRSAGGGGGAGAGAGGRGGGDGTGEGSAAAPNAAVRMQIGRAKLHKRSAAEAQSCDEHPAVHKIQYQMAKIKHTHFHFCYGENGALRQTVDIAESRCPWCRLNCMSMTGLLHHLATNHDRCDYQIKRNEIGSVDICATPLPSQRSTRLKPDVAEWGVTTALETKPADRAMQLDDVLAEDLYIDPTDRGKAPKKRQTKKALEQEKKAAIVDPSKRQYYHSRTFLPMDNPMSDEDSEVEETDFDIILETRTALLNQFDDVNDGEKWMMKLWNEFVTQRPGIPLVHKCVYDAAKDFTGEYAAEISAMKLRRNYVLHLTNLHNFGLLSPEQLRDVIAIFNATSAEGA